MTQPSVASRSSGGPWSAIAAHPITSAVIAILIIATTFFSLYVPLYASATPKIGDFPFFYFYLIAYMPVVAIVLGIVLALQKRLSHRHRGAGAGRDHGHRRRQPVHAQHLQGVLQA
jgi:membrane protein implicated in regulation of membrane protease activity